MNRRQYLKGMAGLAALLAVQLPGAIFAMGPDDKFTIAQLRYKGADNSRPTALRRLTLEVEKRTSIVTAPKIPRVKATDKALYEYPLLFWSGDQAFDALSDKAVQGLRDFLLSGGLLVVDTSDGVIDGPFLQSVRRELDKMFPNRKLGKIPSDHVLYKSFFLVDKPVGRLAISKSMDGIFDDDRLMVIVSQNDLMGAWSKDNFGSWTFSCTPGGDKQREMSYRLGMNIVMYALCINYKADQVHVPFILKRRKWKVD